MSAVRCCVMCYVCSFALPVQATGKGDGKEWGGKEEERSGVRDSLEARSSLEGGKEREGRTTRGKERGVERRARTSLSMACQVERRGGFELNP